MSIPHETDFGNVENEKKNKLLGRSNYIEGGHNRLVA